MDVNWWATVSTIGGLCLGYLVFAVNSPRVYEAIQPIVFKIMVVLFLILGAISSGATVAAQTIFSALKPLSAAQNASVEALPDFVVFSTVAQLSFLAFFMVDFAALFLVRAINESEKKSRGSD